MIGEVTQDWRAAVEAIVRHHRFESAAGMLVCLNIICLGVATQIDSIYDLNPPRFYRAASEAVDFMFMCCFVIEWLLRVYVDRWDFLLAEETLWNWFDTFIVGLQVFDQAVMIVCMWGGTHSRSRSLGMLRMLRILRLLRILRVARLLHLFDELDTLLRSIGLAATALMWALFLMLTMVYAFSVFFVQRTLEMTGGSPSPELAYYFGGIPRTALTLFESLMGGVSWDVPTLLLYSEVGGFSASVFIVYVSIGLFIALNMATGVFINKAMQTAEEESNLRIAEGLAAAFGLTGLENANEEVTLETFRAKLEEPGMASYLEKVSIDDEHIDKFYGLVDSDNSHSVTFSELITGCLKLSGPARAVDIALLAQDQKELNSRLERHVELVELMVGSFMQPSQSKQFGALASGQRFERLTSEPKSQKKVSVLL
jgi:hypothetical protein